VARAAVSRNRRLIEAKEPMARYISRRLLLSLVTLWLLATIVFIIANVLPNDVGRTILGPFAPQESVDALNERLGTNRPIFIRYVDTMAGLVTLDFGDSFITGKPVLPDLMAAVARSAKLAGLALFLTIPVAILAGLYAARRRDKLADRGIVLLGVTSSSIPEFVTGTILVVVVGVQLKLLPVLATPPPNADIPTQIRYLLMPATAMAIVYFGYIARMTRSGTIDVLQSDYTRTAAMKGLTTSQTMRRHVLRNALIPTVAVIAVQIGYLFGGIIAVEKIFNYNGMGQTMLFAAQRKDIPTLTAGAIIIGIVYMLATLTSDLIIAWMNPRIRLDSDS
jgi:peptide/nickel transport system permease protein